MQIQTIHKDSCHIKDKLGIITEHTDTVFHWQVEYGKQCTAYNMQQSELQYATCISQAYCCI